jgi:hypothetical protein
MREYVRMRTCVDYDFVVDDDDDDDDDDAAQESMKEEKVEQVLKNEDDVAMMNAYVETNATTDVLSIEMRSVVNVASNMDRQ